MQVFGSVCSEARDSRHLLPLLSPSGYFLPSSLASCLLGYCLPPGRLGIPADCLTGANCRLLGSISSYFQSGINHFHQVPGELSLWISLVSRDKLGPKSLSFSLCSLLSS